MQKSLFMVLLRNKNLKSVKRLIKMLRYSAHCAICWRSVYDLLYFSRRTYSGSLYCENNAHCTSSRAKITTPRAAYASRQPGNAQRECLRPHSFSDCPRLQIISLRLEPPTTIISVVVVLRRGHLVSTQPRTALNRR